MISINNSSTSGKTPYLAIFGKIYSWGWGLRLTFDSATSNRGCCNLFLVGWSSLDTLLVFSLVFDVMVGSVVVWSFSFVRGSVLFLLNCNV